MLKIPNPIGDEKADAIVSQFVNDRLIRIMEDIILDEVVWKMVEKGEVDSEAATKDFDELVDLTELITDMDFAEMVSMVYLPDNYPIERANRTFFGLYKLLKAKKEYVPKLEMEYVLYSVIGKEVGEVDLINSDMMDGLFDNLEDDFDGFDDDIEDDFCDGDEEYTTIERIPEADRIIVKNAVMKVNKEGLEGEELEDMAEYTVSCYEDLREYFEICLPDSDCLLLDNYTEQEFLDAEREEDTGRLVKAEKNIIEFPFKDKDGNQTNVRAEFDIDPWDLEED